MQRHAKITHSLVICRQKLQALLLFSDRFFLIFSKLTLIYLPKIFMNLTYLYQERRAEAGSPRKSYNSPSFAWKYIIQGEIVSQLAFWLESLETRFSVIFILFPAFCFSNYFFFSCFSIIGRWWGEVLPGREMFCSGVAANSIRAFSPLWAWDVGIFHFEGIWTQFSQL